MKNRHEMKSFYESLPEFDGHNAVIFINDPLSGLRGYIAFHRGGFRTPSFGATRLWDYEDDTEALKDALRLSRMMSYKNAMAGLPYGGAKAALIKPRGPFNKSFLLERYAKHVERLKGAFVTGTDVGLDLADIKKMFKVTKHLVGFRNNPEKATAMGIFYSMQTVAKHLYGKNSLKGLSFAIQGVGKVGGELVGLLYPYASKIIVSDIDPAKTRALKKKYPKIQVVDRKQICHQAVDIFSPCALSNVLNLKSINKIRAKAIVGSANNQLRSPEVAETLYRLGILYCPDYVVNAGGLIAVAEEYKHPSNGKKSLEKKVKDIGARLDHILALSKKHKKSPATIADELSQKIMANHK